MPLGSVLKSRRTKRQQTQKTTSTFTDLDLDQAERGWISRLELSSSAGPMIVDQLHPSLRLMLEYGEETSVG